MANLGLRYDNNQPSGKLLRFDANWNSAITPTVVEFFFHIEDTKAELKFSLTMNNADVFVNDLNQRLAGSYPSSTGQQPATVPTCDNGGGPAKPPSTFTYNILKSHTFTTLFNFSCSIDAKVFIDVWMTANQAQRLVNTLDQMIGRPNQG